MANHAKLVNTIDEHIFKIGEIAANFEEFEQDKEIGKKRILTFLRKEANACEFAILELMRELQLSTKDFDDRRKRKMGGI